MRSIKPGRGPSFMGGIISVAVSIFGVFWTIMAASVGAPGFFPLFGVVFVIIGIAQAVYNFKNATGKNRFSAYDITDEYEEPDPLNERYGNRQAKVNMVNDSRTGNFCPYCGARAKADYEFCKQCGKRLS